MAAKSGVLFEKRLGQGYFLVRSSRVVVCCLKTRKRVFFTPAVEKGKALLRKSRCFQNYCRESRSAFRETSFGQKGTFFQFSAREEWPAFLENGLLTQDVFLGCRLREVGRCFGKRH